MNNLLGTLNRLLPWRTLVLATALVSSAVAEESPVQQASEPLDFNRDVRPILSDKCYFCHGPDEAKRESGLRLDVRSEAIDLIEGGDFLDRVDSDDEDLQMPPPSSKLALTDAEKLVLQQWVDQGAVYADHWAFEQIPAAVSVPQVSDASWGRGPIDQFVMAGLDTADMHPNPPADPQRWLRRVTMDLTGLPPTPEQIAEFETSLKNTDADKQVFESTVEDLLASDSFGQHFSVSWLDAARYADSYGYQSDKLNTQWPYRDWVVRMLNQNLPYDQFLTWQIAGDLLPEATRDQKLATAFNRIHRLNNEGGAVFEEWRIENVADRVHTFGTAVLGLTMECCRCHDHKYDPIPMRDYYSLSAFFNSIDESGVYDRTEKVPCPSILLPTTDEQTAISEAAAALNIAEAEYTDTIERSQERYSEWIAQQQTNKRAAADHAIPDLRLALAFDEAFDKSLKEIYHPSQSDRSWAPMSERVPVADCQIPWLDTKLAADRVHAETADAVAGNLVRQALSLDGERGVTTHGIEPFDRWTPFSVVVTLRDTKRTDQRSVIAHHTRGTDCGYNGWDLTIDGGHLESRLARVWPGNAIAVRTSEPIPADAWHQVTASYDGSSRADGLKLFLDGVRLETVTLRDEVKKRANVSVDHGGEFVVGQRFRARGFDGGLIDDVRIFQRALSETELQHLATGAEIDTTHDYFVSAVDPASRAALAKLTKAREVFVMAEEVVVEIPIMRELPIPRVAHLLARGQYDAPVSDATRVPRQTFTQFGLPWPADAPRDRLGLARWVTDPANPLTARVAVNRLWSNFFADPIVRTPENFGLQGELPTHPELLDWLSRDFISSGWDVKRLCKRIALSSTYRQDSRASREQIDADPENRLLARGPAHRLAAEQIRDLALAASGLLDDTRGGPPVSPYQPGEDLWRESNGMSPPYQRSVGKSLYRRSLYSVWKRTAPLPNMLALDATTREVCSVKRSRTNTPLQALVLLNDVQFVEAARMLAQHVISTESEMDPIDQAFLRLAGRRPDESETKTLRALYDGEREYFTANPDRASELISIGESAGQPDLATIEIAAMTTVCQAILNLDATVWKR